MIQINPKKQTFSQKFRTEFHDFSLPILTLHNSSSTTSPKMLILEIHFQNLQEMLRNLD